MAFIDIQYDPEWQAFQKSYQAANPLVETAQEKSDQGKLDQFLKGLYDPKSPGYHQYSTDFNAQFPGVAQWTKDQMDFNKAMQDAFAKQYGHSPILNTTVAGPIPSQPTPNAPTPPPTTTPTTTAPITSPTNVTTPTTTPPALVTPPDTSPLYQTPLVTTPGAGMNETWANLLNLPSMSGGGGSSSFPDLLKETQKKWGGFSASQF